MDFKQRFEGRTNNITKNGFSILMNSPGIPIEKVSWKEENLMKYNKVNIEKEERKLETEILELNNQNRRMLPKLSTYFINQSF